MDTLKEFKKTSNKRRVTENGTLPYGWVDEEEPEDETEDFVQMMVDTIDD